MEGTTFVLFILMFFVLPITIYGIWTSHKKEMAKEHARAKGPEVEKLQLEVQELKKRLQVVEAIVTDEKYQLKQELHKLA